MKESTVEQSDAVPRFSVLVRQFIRRFQGPARSRRDEGIFHPERHGAREAYGCARLLTPSVWPLLTSDTVSQVPRNCSGSRLEPSAWPLASSAAAGPARRSANKLILMGTSLSGTRFVLYFCAGGGSRSNVRQSCSASARKT